MTEELNIHIEKRYSECRKRSQGLSYGSFYDGYVDCYYEQQERVTELEKENSELKADNDARKFAMAMSEKVEKQLREQIKKMKCCANCRYSESDVLNGTFCHHKDYGCYMTAHSKCYNWELAE